MKKIFYLLLVVFVAACANEYMPQEPENLIPEDKFIEMIVDIHIADAVLSNEQMHDVNLADTTKSYYNFVFNKHQVSRYDFNENMKYYTAQTARFEKMYASVIDKLEVKAAEATEKAKEKK